MNSIIAKDPCFVPEARLEEMRVVTLTPVELQMATAVGKMRTEASAGAKTRTMKTDNDETGACGEIAFADYFHIPWDWRNKPEGDGGIDFTVNGVTIDVKTTKGGPDRRLMVKEGEVFADIYVLALRSPDNPAEITLAGWESNAAVSRVAPCKLNEKFVFSNHMILAKKLQPIDNLVYFLGNVLT